jgi:hypothetical protein
VYFKEGATLATGNTTTAEFLEPTATEWRQECVELGSYASSNVLLKFTGVNGYGNNIYVDDIQIDNADCQGTVSLHEWTYNNKISIYPNPSDGNAQLIISDQLGQKLQIVVLNVIGEVVWQDIIFVNSDSYSYALRDNNIAAGSYFIQLRGERGLNTALWQVRK